MRIWQTALVSETSSPDHAGEGEAAEIEDEDELERGKLLARAPAHDADDQHQEQVAENGAKDDEDSHVRRLPKLQWEFGACVVLSLSEGKINGKVAGR